MTGARLVAPVYHAVTDKWPLYLRGAPGIKNVAEFEADLDWLLQHFNPIGLDVLIDAARTGKTLPSRALFLSFDDGHRELADVVAPILEQKGVPATFFLCTSLLDNRA